MKNSLNYLRHVVRGILQEVDISEVEGVCMAYGSTHIMNTCFIGGDQFHLKFSDDAADFDITTDPSLQILVEYMAYRLYGLYPGVVIPSRIELVFDKDGQRVGLATKSVKSDEYRHVTISELGAGLSAGVYVDVFLANWDIANTENIIVPEKGGAPVRIDPGGALTFRARGAKKGKNFSEYPGELDTMIGGSSPAAYLFSYSDLKIAAKTFASVPWQQIEQECMSLSYEIFDKLKEYGFNTLETQWNKEFAHILKVLRSRHSEILKNVKFMSNMVD